MPMFGTILNLGSTEVQKYTGGIFLHSLLLVKTQVKNRACVLNKSVVRQVFLRILW
jgi:hypothetical protein